MNGFGGLLRKELIEQLKTFRPLTFGAVLMIFGIGGMVLDKFLPQILSSQNVNIEIPTFTIIDALADYGGNVVQLGTLTVVLLVMGSVARERENGIAALTLSKPVSEAAYVLAKVAAHFAWVIVGTVVISLVALAYAVGLFPGSVGAGVAWFFATLVLFLWFAAAITIGASCYFRNQIAAGVIALAVVLLLSTTSAVPVIGDYVPGAVLTWGNRSLVGTAVEPRWAALAVMAAVSIAAVVLGWRRLRTVDL